MVSVTRLFSGARASTPPPPTYRKTSHPQWAGRVLCIALSLASIALASPVNELPDPTGLAAIRLAAIDGEPRPTSIPQPTPTPDTFDELILDDRIAFWDGEKWLRLHPAEHELRRRSQEASGSVTTTVEIPLTQAPSTTPAVSTPIRSTVTVTAGVVATESPLPTFFDGGIADNFTESSCPVFIENMITNPEFNECYPISLLLQGSTSFFDAEKSLVSISRVLDNACAANVTSCAVYLADVASNLTKTENCGDDYNLGNPTVTNAYEGLVAYQVVYAATCLKDEDTSVYCFGDAVTNTTNPSNVYFYNLPLNDSLPQATNPTCNECLQNTMEIYHVATANRRQPIASTYEGAAQLVDSICGTGFSNVTLAAAITTSFAPAMSGPSTGLLVLTLLAMSAGFLL